MGTLDRLVSGRVGSQKPRRVLHEKLIPEPCQSSRAIWIFGQIYFAGLEFAPTASSSLAIGSMDIGEIAKKNLSQI
jgi:hypothetical protein